MQLKVKEHKQFFGRMHSLGTTRDNKYKKFTFFCCSCRKNFAVMLAVFCMFCILFFQLFFHVIFVLYAKTKAHTYDVHVLSTSLSSTNFRVSAFHPFEVFCILKFLFSCIKKKKLFWRLKPSCRCCLLQKNLIQCQNIRNIKKKTGHV